MYASKLVCVCSAEQRILMFFLQNIRGCKYKKERKVKNQAFHTADSNASNTICEVINTLNSD
jgi:hypothetical protein